MAYRTKVEVRTGGKVYAAGDILPDTVSALDLKFLKSKGFVDLVEVSAAVAAADADAEADDVFDEAAPEVLKTPEEIKKIRKKADLYDYAQSVGLDLGDDYAESTLAELAEAVINYQEELEAGTEAAEE